MLVGTVGGFCALKTESFSHRKKAQNIAMRKRSDISSILIIGAVLVAVSAHASQPTSGKSFGAWRVGNFAAEVVAADDDLAGTYDVAVTVSQSANCRSDGGDCDELKVSWSGGSEVAMSAYFGDCVSRDGEDSDFERFYTIPLHRWKKAGQAMDRQIESDFKAWLGQAALICEKPERAAAFDLKQLRPAVQAFTQVLTKF